MKTQSKTILQTTLASLRGSLFVTLTFSMFINILMLAGPLYMLQVYDRVLPGKSINTLIALSVLLLGLFVVIGGLEFMRSRILSRIGVQLDARGSGPVFDANTRKRLSAPLDDGSDSSYDLNTVRDFYASNALPAFFDLPWVPIYLLILAILHPILGLVGAGGALILFALAWLNNISTHKASVTYSAYAAQKHALFKTSGQNAEVLQAMGMRGALRHLWLTLTSQADTYKTRASDRGNTFTILSKTIRLLLQSAALGVGAALVVNDEMTAGAMIAGTIILGRGLSPVDQSIAHWRSYKGAKAAYKRLNDLLTAFPAPEKRISQPNAMSSMSVERVFAGAPAARKPIVSGLNFTVHAGEALAILGPSASGKSTLARLLSGIWMPQAGHVRLDGVALEQWNEEERGQQIGYLPQDIELFDGTIAQNIARFLVDATDMEIVAAAQAAGVHETILQMTDGYESHVGDGGKSLSGGQRQRIGLARALFRNPFIVVLDEPNANLDSEGDDALAQAINGIKERRGIAIIITHRPSITGAVDKVLVINEGKQSAFGPRNQVLNNHTDAQSNVTPMKTPTLMKAL